MEFVLNNIRFLLIDLLKENNIFFIQIFAEKLLINETSEIRNLYNTHVLFVF